MQLGNTPQTAQAELSAADRTPRAVAWAIGGLVTALVGGAVYLMLVRGDALLLDLSTLRAFFCL